MCAHTVTTLLVHSKFKNVRVYKWNINGQTHKQWIVADGNMNYTSLSTAICPVSRSNSQKQYCANDITAQTWTMAEKENENRLKTRGVVEGVPGIHTSFSGSSQETYKTKSHSPTTSSVTHPSTLYSSTTSTPIKTSREKPYLGLTSQSVSINTLQLPPTLRRRW